MKSLIIILSLLLGTQAMAGLRVDGGIQSDEPKTLNRQELQKATGTYKHDLFRIGSILLVNDLQLSKVQCTNHLINIRGNTIQSKFSAEPGVASAADETIALIQSNINAFIVGNPKALKITRFNEDLVEFEQALNRNAFGCKKDDTLTLTFGRTKKSYPDKSKELKRTVQIFNKAEPPRLNYLKLQDKSAPLINDNYLKSRPQPDAKQ